MIRRVVVALALLAGLAHAAETPIPAAPTRWVTDQAGLLSPATRDELDHRLEQYQQSTGHQVIVWIGTTLGDAPIDDWSAKAFAKWQLGRKGKDDGVAIFVFATDHHARIEVGYGLEDKLPDAYAARILQDTLEPDLKAGHADVAITGTVAGVLDRLGDETGGASALKPAVRPASLGTGRIVEVVFGVIIVIFVIGMAITHPQLALLLLQIISSFGGGGGGGGFGGGGGGFSGGGGRSGGGGASGSW